MQKNGERDSLLKPKLTEAGFLQERVTANILTAKKKRSQQINERRMQILKSQNLTEETIATSSPAARAQIEQKISALLDDLHSYLKPTQPVSGNDRHKKGAKVLSTLKPLLLTEESYHVFIEKKGLMFLNECLV